MAKLRHVAMSVPDPAATAKFYKETFGMEIVGETDSPLASGVYLTDGTVSLALLNYKADEWAGMNKDAVAHDTKGNEIIEEAKKNPKNVVDTSELAVAARKFGNLLDPESEIRQAMETKRVFILKEDLATHPSFFYFYAT